MTDIHARPYEPRDLAACLAIFDSNVPIWFAPDERPDFCRFLARPEARGGPYLVLVQGADLLACGGLDLGAAPGRAGLTWGMVARAHHGRGLGTRLTEARIALARATPGITELALETSQHTRGFYERFGFALQSVTPDGFGPGLDRCDMVLSLAEARHLAGPA